MKLIALNEFDYQGVRVTPGVFDGSEADMISMSHYGKVRPATSIEVEESQIECAVIPNNRQKAERKPRVEFPKNRISNQHDQT